MGRLMRWRQAMMSQKQPRLPSEYQEVYYLESTGTTYINTLVLPTDNLTYKCGFQFSVVPTGVSNATVFGVYKQVSGGTVKRTQFNYCNNGVLGWGAAFTRYNGTIDSNYHTVIASNTAYLFDGTIIYTPTSHDFSGLDYTVYLFATHATGIDISSTCVAGLRIFTFEISDNDTPVRKFVPCYRKADDKSGMFDLVSKEFFTNIGTGEFVVGADVNY